MNCILLCVRRQVANVIRSIRHEISTKTGFSPQGMSLEYRTVAVLKRVEREDDGFNVASISV